MSGQSKSFWMKSIWFFVTYRFGNEEKKRQWPDTRKKTVMSDGRTCERPNERITKRTRERANERDRERETKARNKWEWMRKRKTIFRLLFKVHSLPEIDCMTLNRKMFVHLQCQSSKWSTSTGLCAHVNLNFNFNNALWKFHRIPSTHRRLRFVEICFCCARPHHSHPVTKS